MKEASESLPMHRSCNFEALNISQEMVVGNHGNDIASPARLATVFTGCNRTQQGQTEEEHQTEA